MRAAKRLRNLNLEPMFAARRKKHPEDKLYLHTDSHWTSFGAFLGYRQAMEYINEHFAQTETALQHSELERQFQDIEGDLAQIVSSGDQPIEERYELRPRKQCARGYQRVAAFKLTEAYKRDKGNLPLVNGCKTGKLTAVIIHDSFGNRVQNFFSESFKRAVFLHSYDLIGIQSLLEKERPDILIDLRVERGIGSLLKPDARLARKAQ